jgi:signal transduction histidine kinase
MLALLLLVVLVAIGCVLWFMREAMLNERMAVREKLAEAYRGQLSMVLARCAEDWKSRLAALDSSGEAVLDVYNPIYLRLKSSDLPAALFARFVRGGLADSVICLDEQGLAAYPRLPSADNAEGRNVDANTELLALESLADKSDPRFSQITGQLRDRVNNYNGDQLPSAQRRFIMHELQRLDPGVEFSTLPGEELAARYLETNPVIVRESTLRATELRDVWSVASPGRRVLALFTTAGLRAKLGKRVGETSLPKGVTIIVVAPHEEAMTESTLVAMSLGPGLPAWRLALSLDDRTLFNTEADRRVTRYLVVGSVVIAAMSVLGLLIARGFGRQVQLARLKNDLVTTVSHELKTPLTAMRALVDTLLDAERFDEKTTREYLKLLATENARLSRLIDNFLTFSRLERNKFTFEFTRVRPQQVVEGAVAALGERAQAPGCVLESHIAADLPSIRGDVDALVTALLNLLDNAWKYSGDEKRIVLRTEARNGSVWFAVEDNGIGLTPREGKRVFRRFYQADQGLSRSAGGCGLGLSIVQSIVEAHHGSVRVESTPGHGSTFTIEIPAVAGGVS